MNRSYAARLGALVATAAAVALTGGPAEATNGFLSICAGAKNCGMAGTGVALPQDASSAAVNPALMARVQNQVFVSPGWFHPDRSADTTGTSNAFVNANLKEDSQVEDFTEGAAGVNYHLNDAVTFGISAYGSGGMHTKYTQPRTLGGAGDSTVRYRLAHFAPTVTWKPNDWSAYGFSLILGYSDFKTNFAVAPMLAETGGHLSVDHAYGVGARLGGMWDLGKMFTLGAAIQPAVHFGQFEKYRDVFLGSIDTPWTFQGGVVWHALPTTDFAFDVKYIAWDQVHSIGVSPNEGGFGWDGKPVFMFGVQHKVTPEWTVRAGYNYGPSPIPDHNVFANTLFPAITEHHLALGTTYNIGPSWELSGSFFYALEAEQTDDGTGDAYSHMGVGTKVNMWQMGAQLGVTWKF
jgi:long-chain fatty acid transport protein